MFLLFSESWLHFPKQLLVKKVAFFEAYLDKQPCSFEALNQSGISKSGLHAPRPGKKGAQTSEEDGQKENPPSATDQ